MPKGDLTERERYAISIGDVPAIVGGVSATSLLLSTIHEWAYFRVIGSKYQSLMTITDYFGSAIEWLPVAILMAVSSTLLGFIYFKVIKWAKIEPWIFMSTFFIVIGVMIAMQLSVFPSYSVAEYSAPILLTSIVFVAYIIRQLRFKNELTGRRFGPFTLGAIAITPGALALAYFLGIQAAYDDMSMPPSHVFALSTTEHPTTTPVIVLRNLQNGILIRLPADNRNEFLRWEDVKALSNLSFAPPNYSRSCIWFGFSCFDKPKPIDP